MNRLKKIALIDSQVKLKDVDFLISENQIEIYLTNNEATLHDGPQEDPQYYKSPSKEISGSEIGFINWEASGKKLILEEDEDGYSKMFVIHINFLEIREEYRQTKCVNYLLDKFVETIVDPAIKKYGKYNVALNASFANDQLGRVVVKKLRRGGIQWLEDLNVVEDAGEITMDSIQNNNNDYDAQKIQEDLSQKGIESTIESDKIVVINQPMGKTLEACQQLRIMTVTGTITLEGDLKLALTKERGFYPSGDGFNFDYYFYGGGIKFKNVQSIEDIKNKVTNLSNLTNNLNTFMSDSQEAITIGDEYFYGKELIDALNTDLQTTASSRLKKRLFK